MGVWGGVFFGGCIVGRGVFGGNLYVRSIGERVSTDLGRELIKVYNIGKN